MSLGGRIIAVRKEKNFSQSDLADKIGIHSNVLGRYEREDVAPSFETVVKIAEALGVTLDYLAGNTDVELDRALLDKVASIQKLPEEDRRHIMYAVDGLIQHAKTRMAYR